ncbi:hypothetical protein G7072_01230 [Nocardioides sp. HDW12B]|uniref:hypothetical protein n=1 Tax=Nocardioides sp. HDW12B TaxID=2714939 RepID=UPI00140A479D|nr:hypothetical protein [Nocardioides sp. HDW12B]QIK65140.1 hypothetical protein G7072_01230 [Nocardioides sp. HDW12B]
MLKFLLVVALFAGVVYAVAWTLERRRTLGKGNALPRRRPAAPPTKQVAPDDDEDFLRWLDRKRHKDSKDSKDGTDGQGQEPAAD